MEKIEIDNLVDLISRVYKNRGYVSFDEVQERLDKYDASLIETNHVMRLLEERGCRITEQYTEGDDFSLYDDPCKESKCDVVTRFSDFLNKEKLQGIPGLDYDIKDYELGVLYYTYLRLVMKLSKIATKQHIACLQEAYNMFLDDGEDKIIFEIQSAVYAQQIDADLRDKKKHGKVKPMCKTAISNYQHFLEKNRHHIIAACEEKL